MSYRDVVAAISYKERVYKIYSSFTCASRNTNLNDCSEKRDGVEPHCGDDHADQQPNQAAQSGDTKSLV